MNANIKNFTIGIYGSSNLSMNFSGVNLTNNSVGMQLISINNSYVTSCYILNNTIGINLSSSSNNTIYNNYFNNTNNAYDNANNTWNISKTNGTNIIGGSYLGGNFWSDYNGTDNVSSDGLGDTQVPYNSSDYIQNGGDYLPLVDNAECGDNIIQGSEQCEPSIPITGTNCTALTGYLYGSVTCSGTCTYVTTACYNSTCGDHTCNGEETSVNCPADCTSGSGTGTTSSGGGGGGGGIPITKANVTCTQSWQCGDWSECVDGKETRTCTDVNDCANKKATWKVDQIISVSKPAESRACNEEVTETPISFPTEQEEEYNGIIPEIVAEPGMVRTITLSSLAALAVFGGVYAYWQYGYAPNRMRRRLKRLNPMLSEESSELLKEEYKGIYGLYLKLSEGHKQNFYTKVTQLRDKIEDQLKAEKRVQDLLQKSTKSGLDERKKMYMEVYNNYLKLPAKSQQKYYPSIVNLREQLERGVK
jgi:hypothetical protein